MYLFIIGLRSVYGIGIRRIGLFNADLAALSTFSLQKYLHDLLTGKYKGVSRDYDILVEFVK